MVFQNKKRTCTRFIALAGVLFGLIYYPNIVRAETVDVEALQEKIAEERSGLPDDLEENPLTAESIVSDTVLVYTDSDLLETCDIVDGSTLSIKAEDATADALFGEYTYSGGTGTGWISIDTFLEDPSFEKQYSTIRRDPPLIYMDSSWEGETYQSLQYTELILINLVGKKHQVIYATEDGYAIGWIKSEDYENTLEYDGSPKQIVADGTYNLHNLSKNDGTNSYADDTYARKITFVYWQDDAYYMIDEKGRWLGTKDGKPAWYKTGEPDPSGLFSIERADDGYTIQNTLDQTYLGMGDSGKLLLVDETGDSTTTWRISALEKMVSLTNPKVIVQYDPEWCGLPYGTDDIDGCIGAAGCGILSPVNAVYALTGQYMDVLELVDFSVDNNYRIVGSGTTDEIFKAIAKKYGANYGFAWDGSSTDINTLVKKLKKGDVAVSHVDGHYITIAACSDDGQEFLFLDSNRLPKRETTAFGDWMGIERLQEGTLASTGYFFYKQFDGKTSTSTKTKKK